MSVETVRSYLAPFGLSQRVTEFESSSATVELAAAAIGTAPQRIAKSLTFYAKDGSCIMLVTAGDQKIDNAKFKAFFSCKAKMMTPEDALAATGHAVGGVCPFALPRGTAVYLDLSLQRFETVFPAAGSPNSAAEMTCEELFTAARAMAWVDICKPRET